MVVIFLSLMIPVFQACMWLRYGDWVEFPLCSAWNMAGFSFPETQWGGVEKALVWIFHQPTSCVVFAADAAMAGIGAKVSE
jgi:hypothetical protein